MNHILAILLLISTGVAASAGDEIQVPATGEGGGAPEPLLNLNRVHTLLDTSLPDLGDMVLPPELGRPREEIARMQKLQRGNQLLEQRDYKRAIDLLEELTQEAPELQIAQLALSTGYINVHRYDEANRILMSLAETSRQLYPAQQPGLAVRDLERTEVPKRSQGRGAGA